MFKILKTIVINGNAGTGKDSFILLCEKYLKEENLGVNIYNRSTVDFVKYIAEIAGWDGTKTPRNRKFLSDLKDILEEWDDVPNKQIDVTIKSLIGLKEDSILFIHAREPHNIQYYKDKYNAITVLVINNNIPQVTSNHADMDVYDYTYDYLIDNNSDLQQLEDSAKTFMNKILENEVEFKNE